MGMVNGAYGALGILKEIDLNQLDCGTAVLAARRESMNIAFDALQKQIPQKLSHPYYKSATVLCPRCGYMMNLNDSHYKYCPDCGQALDWSVFNSSLS